MSTAGGPRSAALLLVVGLLSLVAQVVVLRELAAALYGVELIYVLALGTWLLSTAFGALLTRGYRPHPTHVAALLTLTGLLLVADVVAVRGLRPLTGALPGAFLPFPQQLLAIALAVLPVGLLLGLLFQWSAKLHVGGGGSAPGAYALESLGALVAGFLTTLSIVVGLPNLGLALTGAALALAASLAWRARAGRRTLWLGMASLAAVIALVTVVPAVDRATARWSHPNLVAAADTAYGRVIVTRSEGQTSVFQNDVLAFESHSTDAETFAHVVAVQHPEPATALVIGGGIEGLIGEVRKHGVRVDYVEMDRRMLETALPFLPPAIAGALAEDDVGIHFADPRAFLARTTERYDLILVGMPEPESGQTNRFYTQEFFALCGSRMREGGVLGLRLRSAENFWTPQVRARASSIAGALESTFGHMVLLPGTTDVFVASAWPLERDPARLAARLEARRVQTRLVGEPYLRYVYENDRFARAGSLIHTGASPPNTDVRPVAYQQTAMIWLSKFYASLAPVDLPMLPAFRDWAPTWQLGAAGTLVAVAVTVRLGRRRRRAAMYVLAGAFVGMVVESVLLLHYQTKRGVMYQDIGILLGAVMAGLATGAWSIHVVARRHGASGGWSGWRGNAGAGLLLAALSVLAIVAAVVIERGVAAGLVPVASLLAAIGFLVAAIFAVATVRDDRDPALAIGPLYAADLTGGALAAFLASVVLIPLAGLGLTAWWMGALALAALVFV